jgi:hypothetical protein
MIMSVGLDAVALKSMSTQYMHVVFEGGPGLPGSAMFMLHLQVALWQIGVGAVQL